LTLLMPHLLPPLPSEITLWCKLDLLCARMFSCAYRYEITFWTTEGRVARDLVWRGCQEYLLWYSGSNVKCVCICVFCVTQ
jgi:hypothetical protein